MPIHAADLVALQTNQEDVFSWHPPASQHHCLEPHTILWDHQSACSLRNKDGGLPHATLTHCQKRLMIIKQNMQITKNIGKRKEARTHIVIIYRRLYRSMQDARDNISKI